MSSNSHLARLGQLLGESVSRELGESALQRLVEQGVYEDEQIEFKGELHKGSKTQGVPDGAVRTARAAEERAEFAKDIAAFANSSGGAIIVGVTEEGGRATATRPVSVSDADEAWMTTVVAGQCRPMIPFELIRVAPPGDDTGYWVISVPASVNAPHAVVAPNSPELRYPIRRGTTSSWLSEAEVADRYRDRFATMRSQEDRLAQVAEEGRRGLALDSSPWIVIALVPTIPRLGGLELALSTRTFEWCRALPPSPFQNTRIASAHNRIGLRRTVLGFEYDDAVGSRFAAAEFHADGCAFVALEMQYANSTTPPVDAPFQISLASLFDYSVTAMETAAGYAVDVCQLSSDALVMSAIVDPAKSGGETRPISLDDTQSGFVRQTRPFVQEPVGLHTVDLPATATPTGLLRTIRLVTADLIQALGVVESPLISADGSVMTQRFSQPGRQQIEGWIRERGMPSA